MCDLSEFYLKLSYALYRVDVPKYLLAKKMNGSYILLYILPHSHWKTSMEKF